MDLAKNLFANGEEISSSLGAQEEKERKGGRDEEGEEKRRAMRAG
jgi:hypothetical protein